MDCKKWWSNTAWSHMEGRENPPYEIIQAFAAGQQSIDGAIRATGTVGQDLLTGVLFVTSDAICGKLNRLDEVDIIILPKAR